MRCPNSPGATAAQMNKGGAKATLLDLGITSVKFSPGRPSELLRPQSEHADEIAWVPAAHADPVGGPRLFLLPEKAVDPSKLLAQRAPDRSALSVVYHADGDYARRRKRLGIAADLGDGLVHGQIGEDSEKMIASQSPTGSNSRMSHASKRMSSPPHTDRAASMTLSLASIPR